MKISTNIENICQKSLFFYQQARDEPGGGQHVRGHPRHPRPHPGQGHHRTPGILLKLIMQNLIKREQVEYELYQRLSRKWFLQTSQPKM